MPSDLTRDQKLAAARKKLKKYQSKKAQNKNTELSDDLNRKVDQSVSPVSSGCSTPILQSSQSILNGAGSSVVNATNIRDEGNIAEMQETNQAISEELMTKSKCDVIKVEAVEVTNKSSSLSSENAVPSTSICNDVNSTTESLRQLSLQINGVMDDSRVQEEPNKVVVELERRNEELAGLLNLEHQAHLLLQQQNQNLHNQLLEKQGQIAILQGSAAEFDQLNANYNELKKELEAHIETVRMLSSDKSNLQSTLHEAQNAISAKSDEVSTLSKNCETSKDYARQLDLSLTQKQKEFLDLSESQESIKYQLEELQQQLQLVNFTKDEMQVTIDELKERLTSKSSENESLNKEIASLTNQLELSKLHVQQLRDTTNDELSQKLLQLQTVNAEANNQISFLTSTIEQVQHEKITLEHQYKSYTNQLTVDLEESKHKVEKMENALKKVQEENQSLQNSLTEMESKVIESKKLIDAADKWQELKIEFETCKAECSKWENKASSLERDNEELSKMLNSQREAFEQMERTCDRRSYDQVDTEQLLQSMQSDKVAAARALQQNKQLKEQLEELQNGFVMMSNKKLELTEKLEVELHAKKALNKQIAELNEQILSKESLLNKEIQSHEIEQHKPVDVITEPVENSSENVPPINCVKQETQESQTESFTLNETNETDLQKAHEALQSRFARCMTELAQKIDENQRLEHLVTQLQLETEAVGDYITIYQFQRGVMKKKMAELKDQLEHLRNEKQQLCFKLTKLQVLAKNLAPNTSNSRLIEHINTMAPQKEDHVNEDETETEVANSVVDESGSKTVKKIIDLINEMETANQMEHSTVPHPCHLCSGQLIHV